MIDHFDQIELKADNLKFETIEVTIDEATSCLTLDNNFIFIDKKEKIYVYGLMAKKVVLS